jgi:ABC-type transport system substrate-binding protein
MKISTSTLPAIQHQWQFGGTYFASPDKLDPKVPFVDKRVRQAMNMAVNRQAIANAILGGKVQPHWVHGYHPKLDGAIWPGIWNPDWDKRFEELYGYDPAKAKALLAQAGYPQGFEFTLYLYTLPGLPEIIDIGQAIALDFQAIGLKPKLVETEFSRVRELYRTKSIHGALFATRHSARALEVARNVHKAKDSVGYWYEHPFMRSGWQPSALRWTQRRGRACCVRSGTISSTSLLRSRCSGCTRRSVNPKYIAEYTFPGVITGYFTHLEYVKLAP